MNSAQSHNLPPTTTLRPHLKNTRDSFAKPSLVMLAMALTCAPIHAEIEIARGALFGDLTVLREYDSNIFGNNFEFSDWHTVYTPGISFVRDVGLIRADAAAGVDFQRFEDFSLENSEDPFFASQLTWKRDETKTDAAFAASARRNSGVNPDANTRTQDDSQSVSASFGVFATEKVGYRLLGSWNNRDYLTPGLTNIRDASLGAEGRYQYSSKFETFLSVGSRWTSTYGEPAGQMPTDSRDWKVAVGATGELLPKITGRAGIGWVERSFKKKAWPDQSGLLLEAALDWAIDEETHLGFTAKRDFDTSPTDQSIEKLEVSIEGQRTLREKIVLTCGIAYLESNYLGDFTRREDDAYVSRLGFEYVFTERYHLKFDAIYQLNESTQLISEYERYILGASFVAKF